MIKRSIFLLMMMVALPVLASCTSDEAADNKQTTASGDLQVKTASTQEMPEFLADKSEEMQQLYLVVAQHKDLLESIPCYCGCGEFGHQDNYDCFIHENGEDGSVVWDDHATRCQACLDIAATSIVKYNEGESIGNIRHMIDEQYQEGYAEPTPTPEI